MNARGKWVCILDADDLLAPSYMETMLARATERNEVFLAAGIEVFSANSANKPLRERIHQAKAIMHDRNSDSLKFVDFLNLGVDIKPFFPLAVVRDNEIKQVGLGSEWLEFIANLFRSGLDLVLVDEPLYFYRVHGSNFSSRYEQVNQDIEACDRLLASVCLSVDEREALISKRRGYMRHRPWKALHRGMLLRGFLDFLQAPGSIVQGCALLRFEIAKRLTKRKLGHGQECA
jgi:glycosyltransferase involved in cell wall biosynthesis